MSTVEDLRHLLAEIADTANIDAGTVIRQRIAEIERDTVAQWRPDRD